MTRRLSGHGHCRVAAPPDVVWHALQDPAALHAVTPGAEQVTHLDGSRFAARLSFGVGRLRAVSTVMLTLLRSGDGARLTGEAAGRWGGGLAEADVTLTPDADGTTIRWRYAGSVHGAYALLGASVLRRASSWFVARFFDALAERLTSAAPAPPGTADAPPCPATRTAPSRP